MIFLTTVFPYILSKSNFVELVPGLIIIALFIWILFGTGYHVGSNTLKIRIGPLKQTVDIQEFKNITKEKSLWSAAALATDRLVIRYGKHNKYVLVSPKKEYEFIKLLLSKNPQIQIDDSLTKLYKL